MAAAFSSPRRIAAFALTLLLGIAAARLAGASTVSTFATGITNARGLAVDASAQLYITSRYPNGKIYRCTPPSNTMSVFASGFVDPIDMVFDDSGNMFVTDYDNAGSAGRVYKVTPGGVKSVFASIANPGAITRDAAGNLYVGEYFTQKIDKITPSGVVSAYVASIGVAGARLTMLYMDNDGTLYAGMLSGTIYKVGPGGSPVTTFNSSMGSSIGFIRDGYGGWLASSYDGDQIWRISGAGVGTLLCGSTPGGHVDGTLAQAKFIYASGIEIIGNVLYVAEYGPNNDVRAIELDGEATPVGNTTWGRLKAAYR